MYAKGRTFCPKRAFRREIYCSPDPGSKIYNTVALAEKLEHQINLVLIQFLPFPTDSTDCQLILQAANRFHRLPADANRAVSRSAAVGGLKTCGIGWQPVEPVGNRWNQLTTSEIIT
jgi:hypothetical protein